MWRGVAAGWARRARSGSGGPPRRPSRASPAAPLRAQGLRASASVDEGQARDAAADGGDRGAAAGGLRGDRRHGGSRGGFHRGSGPSGGPREVGRVSPHGRSQRALIPVEITGTEAKRERTERKRKATVRKAERLEAAGHKDEAAAVARAIHGQDLRLARLDARLAEYRRYRADGTIPNVVFGGKRLWRRLCRSTGPEHGAGTRPPTGGVADGPPRAPVQPRRPPASGSGPCWGCAAPAEWSHVGRGPGRAACQGLPSMAEATWQRIRPWAALVALQRKRWGRALLAGSAENP